MKLTWLGTAGFLIQVGKTAILTDPFVSRNADASPAVSIDINSFKTVDRIFLSHGHFDHIFDVPQIVARSKARVYCSSVTARTLERCGIPMAHIEVIQHNGQETNWKTNGIHCSARAIYSRHVRFDLPFMISTVSRCGLGLFKLIPELLFYPCGQVLAWEISIENKRILFFGTAGSGTNELEVLAREPVDILLMPLHGHSNICDIGLEYIRVLRPEQVIPCHYDDFFPPLSHMVDISPFLQGIREMYPDTTARVVSPGEPFLLK